MMMDLLKANSTLSP